MKELLIIRSVSFQQLDKNLAAILQKFGDYRINLLTHEHGVLLAEKYRQIDGIIVYPHTSGFKFQDQVPALKDKTFEAAIVPVTNVTGAGFFNVLLFSLTIKAKKRILCNVRSELKEMTRFSIFALAVKNGIIAMLSSIFTAVSLVIVLPVLPLQLMKIQKKESPR